MMKVDLGFQVGTEASRESEDGQFNTDHNTYQMPIGS